MIKCKNCYYRRDGECWFNPPVPVAVVTWSDHTKPPYFKEITGVDILSRRPEVFEDGFCGRFIGH